MAVPPKFSGPGISHMIMLACKGIRLRNKISYLKTTSPKQLCNTEGHSLILSRNKTILSLPLFSYTLSSNHSDFTLVLAYFYPRAFAHGVPLQGIFLLFLTGTGYFLSFRSYLQCHFIRETFLNHLSKVGLSHVLCWFSL